MYLRMPRKVLHHNFVYFAWLELASMAYRMYERQGRGAILITDDELIRHEGLAFYIPLDDKDAQAVLVLPEIFAALRAYDPETEFVAVFIDDNDNRLFYKFGPLTPADAKFFFENYLLPGQRDPLFIDDESDSEEE